MELCACFEVEFVTEISLLRCVPISMCCVCTLMVYTVMVYTVMVYTVMVYTTMVYTVKVYTVCTL